MVRKARCDHQALIIRTARQTEVVMSQNNNITTGQAAASSLNSPMRGCRELNRKMRASVFFLFNPNGASIQLSGTWYFGLEQVG